MQGRCDCCDWGRGMSAVVGARERLVDRIALFLATSYPCDCGSGDSCTEEPEADAIVELMEAAGFGDVRDAAAKALEDAADDYRTSKANAWLWLRARAAATRESK